MLIENTFTVAAMPDAVWSFLLDVERIAPCMPGAELTETLDDRNWKGTVLLRFGPVAMSFAGTVSMESRDDDAHRLVLRAKGREQKGKGAADASVTSWLEPGPGADQTTVKIRSEITLVGAAAQLSRGLLPEISRKLTQQFADCLGYTMATQTPAAGTPPTTATEPDATAPETPADAAPGTGAAHPPAAAPRPVGAIGLALSAVWRILVRFLRRVFGGPG